MRKFCVMVGMFVVAGVAMYAFAQRPERPERSEGPAGEGRRNSADAALEKLMRFDKNGNGELSRDEITDDRLVALFERADADKNGIVTKAELTALFAKEARSERGGPGDRGPGDRPRDAGRPASGQPRTGGPRDDAPLDERPRGDRVGGPPRGGRPRPGQILPSFLQDELRLSNEQRKQFDELQREVDARLEKILTAEQKRQLEEMRDRGPGEPPAGAPPTRGPGRSGPPSGADRGEGSDARPPRPR